MLFRPFLSGSNLLGRFAGTLTCAILLQASSSSGSLPDSRPEGQPAPTGGGQAVSELTALGVRSFAPAPKRAPTRIVLQNGIEFDTRTGEPALPAALLASAAPVPGERIALLVQTEAPVESGWLRELEAAGASVECFVPNSAFLVRAAAEDRASIERLSFVRWTGFYHPGYRLSSRPAPRSTAGLGDRPALPVIFIPAVYPKQNDTGNE